MVIKFETLQKEAAEVSVFIADGSFRGMLDDVQP